MTVTVQFESDMDVDVPQQKEIETAASLPRYGLSILLIFKQVKQTYTNVM